MTACNRPPCPGTITETGFCGTCFRRPLPVPEPDPKEPSGSTTRGSGIWVSDGLLPLPPLDLPDPGTLVLEAIEQDQLKLRKGDLVADRYEVFGPLARGGFGWVYLARATHLDDIYVVLKGLIDTSDKNARTLVARERLALTRLDHPKVVRIYDFVRHPDPVSGEPIDYIVMEYIGGPSLDDLLHNQRWKEQHGPLRVWHAIAYTQEILDALAYLHSRELLYCDMKPANAIRGADRLKVIDLGAVRGLYDRESPAIETGQYRAPRKEIDQYGWTVRSDLHTVGITLRELFDGTADRHAVRGPLAFGLASLERVIERATGRYERRFASAAEMSQQLRGVLREILALRGDVLEPSPSVLFESAVTLLDDGLGTVAPLAGWTGEAAPGSGTVLADGCPPARAVAVGLPAPRVSADDPGANYLATVGASNPRALIETLHAPKSVEIPLRGCRVHIELGDTGHARDRLHQAEALLGAAASFDWRIAWHRGLLELAEGQIKTAESHFMEVYCALPGEDPPKLALGFCAEHLSTPQSYYEAVWKRDRSQVSAAFGLARVRLSSAGRAAAVEVLDSVPDESRHSMAARIAAVRLRCSRLPGNGSPGDGLPSAADFKKAAELLSTGPLAGSGLDKDSRTRLIAAIRKVALDVRCERPNEALPGSELLGDPPTERVLRERLEESLISLAEQARDAHEHGVLLDLANSVRPRTWW